MPKEMQAVHSIRELDSERMDENMQQLKGKQRLLVGFTLFGMFFGAGNLIFPVHLGQLAGKNAGLAMAGFIITAVGIPILAVAAIGMTHSDGLHALSKKIGTKYGYFFTCLLYLTIGPFFAIPRCAATSFTVGMQPLLQGLKTDKIAQAVFSAVFFSAVLYCSLRPARITVWIGKIINPVFLVFLCILVLVALLHPGTGAAEVQPSGGYVSNALMTGCIEGYGTMDAIAGLAFGIVVIDIIQSMGVTEDHAIAREVLISGILTGILMAAIYAATIVMGAQSRGLFETAENGGTALAQIADHYLGFSGRIVLAVTIIFACLKTSIGLVTSCSEAFSRMFPKEVSYRIWAVLFTLFSFVVSNVGLSKIITYAVPLLMFLYPLTITLILLSLFEKLFGGDRAVYVSVTAFTCVAAVFDLCAALPDVLSNVLHAAVLTGLAEKYLPLYTCGLGWAVPALAGLVSGIIYKTVRGSKKR